MAITNINNDHFDQSQIDEVTTALGLVIEVLSRKTRNLTPDERKQWGSINEQNKLVAMKTLEYAENQPQLKSPDVDYAELRKDWDDRMFLAGIIAQMENAIRISDNIRITHDWDAMQAARQDYRHAEYKTATDGGAGWENKYKALKEFFTTNPGGSAEVPAEA